MKMQCRDGKFYEKLNFYLCARSSTSPERTVNDSFASEPKTEKKAKEIKTGGSIPNRNYEAPAIVWSSPDTKNSPKKSSKIGKQAAKSTPSTRVIKLSGLNVLN